MKPTIASVIVFVSVAAAFAADPTPIDKYEVLIGEGLAGSGFVVRHADSFWAVCSLHQFDGDSPNQFEQLEGDPIELDPAKIIKQQDVQALRVKRPAADLQFLPYEPTFALKEDDELIVLGPAGEVVPGLLGPKGLNGETYDSKAGPLTLELRTEQPFVAAGGSGAPVILKKSGAVVGVLLSADDGKNARVVGFETLCLAGADGQATGKLTLKASLEPLVEKLPKGSDWVPEPVEVPRNRFGLVYISLPPTEQDSAVKATRQIVGFGGVGPPPKDEAVSFTVTEFSDAEIAGKMPAWLADGYKQMLPIFRASGISIADLRILEFEAVKADASKLIRARGTQGDPKQPFSNTVVRATRGLYMVELVLRNLDLTDKELAELVTSALDRADSVAADQAAPAKK